MEAIKIGKNIIENLTLGMYENKYTIFREYIQNSADSIDKALKVGILKKEEAEIDIEINQEKNYIKVYDNAMGISKDSFKKILSSIADSEKDSSKDKGFRGIGRLAGLAYCKKMIFRSSFKGENRISKMIWDGESLREILLNREIKMSAFEVIEKIISYEEIMGEKEEHFFEVTLEGITKENKELLDIEEVTKYLSEVSPIPYKNNFIYSSKIYDFVERNNLKLDEYKVMVNDRELFKPYVTNLYEKLKDSEGSKKKYDEIKDIEIKEFYNNKQELIAWMWIGICGFERNIPPINQMRGVRLRKENIEIGNSETLNKFFREERGNGYYIGEIFVVDSELIPNARRDYFITNSKLNEFEEVIKDFLYTEMTSYYYYASKVKSALKKKNEYFEAKKEYINKEKMSGFASKEAKEKEEKELEEKKKKYDSAERELKNREREAKDNKIKNRILEIILENRTEKIDENKDISNKTEERKKSKKQPYMAQDLQNLNKRERKLVGEIYNIINNILTKDMSKIVIEKIQEELSKKNG